MASCYEVIGYVVEECTLICADCLEPGESDDSPIFGDTETDCPSHCERCGELIPETLTTDGCEYVREAVWEGTGVREVLEVWVSEFWYAFPACRNCGERLDTIGMGSVGVQEQDGSQTHYYCNAGCYNQWHAEELVPPEW